MWDRHLRRHWRLVSQSLGVFDLDLLAVDDDIPLAKNSDFESGGNVDMVANEVEVAGLGRGVASWPGRIKRWAVSLVIVGYLGSLGYGIVCHTLNFNTGSHPAMYFVVWDMFCGWSAYANRVHIIGQGEDNKYYSLAPGPWTEFTPFGSLARHHYDPFLNHAGQLAKNCLDHTSAKPMKRILVVEEYWAKKYNLPDSVWNYCFDEPRERYSYFQVRQILAPCGTSVRRFPSWLARQGDLAISAQTLVSQPGSARSGLSPELRATMRPFDGLRASRLIPMAGVNSSSSFPVADPERVPSAQ